MIPFQKDYYIQKMKEYNSKIEPTVIGGFSVKYNENLKIFDGYLYGNIEDIDDKVIELKQGSNLWMRISPHEIQGCFESIKRARGRVGVVGLGLGYFTEEVLKKEEVSQVIVYEISEEVIEIYNKNFGENSKLTIIQGDAFKAKREEFDFFFVDIYEYDLRDTVVEHYVRFNEMHNIEEYSFWALEHFLLSCPTEKLVWVYIPEHWMAMAKDLFERFNDAGYVEQFTPIEEEKAVEILNKFKEVL